MPKVLLVNRASPVEIDEATYFGNRVNTSLENNTPYVSLEEKKFLRYKVVDIISSF